MSSPRSRPKPTKRPRRIAEDTRLEILDAAERRLSELGPDGIRLQQIAADVGISHPAVLHHFKNREGLIEAVVRRALEKLEADLIRSVAETQPDQGMQVLDVMELVASVMVTKGHARVLSWLLLSGHAPDTSASRLRVLAEVAHRHRQALSPDRSVDFEDTLFRVLLAALSVIGESVAGPTLRASAGLDDPGAPKRFRAWLAGLLMPPERS